MRRWGDTAQRGASIPYAAVQCLLTPGTASRRAPAPPPPAAGPRDRQRADGPRGARPVDSLSSLPGGPKAS